MKNGTGKSIVSEAVSRSYRVFVAGLLIVTFTLSALFTYNVYRKFQAGLSATVSLLSGSLVPSLLFDDEQSAMKTLGGLSSNKNIQSICVFGKDHQVLAHYGTNTCSKSMFVKYEIEESGSFFYIDRVVTYRQVEYEGDYLGGMIIHSDVKSLYYTILLLFSISLLMVVSVSIGVKLLIKKSTGRMLEPFSDISAAVRDTVNFKEFSLRLPEYEIEEFNNISVGFNDMMREIGSRDRTLRQHKELLEGEVELRTGEYRLAMQEAIAASNAKSEFLSRISHELRTPLNAILGFSQLVLSTGEMDDFVRDSVQEVEKAGGHLLSLINEILDMARVESGKTELNIKSIGLKPVVNDVIDIVKGLPDYAAITLHANISEDIYLEADEVRLRQCMLNLISNAIKYNRPGGEVWISGERSNGWVIIKVKDNGLGIAEENLVEIFEPFKRSAEHCHIEGSGIGLALTQKLIELMGGLITVESEPDVGSVFSVSLNESAYRLKVS